MPDNLLFRRALLRLCLTAILPCALHAETTPRPAFEAAAIPHGHAVRMDGSLSEALWAGAPVITGFLQREPNEGAEPSFRTEARVAYDRTALYVAVRAYDPEPEKLVRILTRRDGHSPSDWIRVIFDSYHDRRSAYEFAVNPAGVRQDRYWFNDGSNDSSWDAVWDVEVSTDEAGWTAEFRIPFSQLRFDPARSGGVFGFAVVRQIGRLNETCTWPLLPRSASGYVSSFGELRGLQLEGSPRRLEIVPYLVSRLEARPTVAGHPFVSSPSVGSAAGLDLKYALTPALTLTATLNPDFGQVEADPAVVNLSAFETFFSERRPFFVEGSGVFRFNVDCNDGECTGLFYSRRIGRSPQGRPHTPAGGFSHFPDRTTILGAAKLTGRAGGFSIGALHALTSSEHARIAAGDDRYRQALEPQTSYSVLRARREFSNQSAVGFMFTSTVRQLTDEVKFLPGQAYTGGTDWDLRMKGGRYSLSGYWAASTIHGSTDSIARLQQNNVHSFQRPDAGHVIFDPTRTSLGGHAGSLSLGKISGSHLRFNIWAGFKSPGFDINDLGFQPRADNISQSNWLQWRRDKPWRRLRTFRFNINQWSGWNFDGDRTGNGGNINAHAFFTSNWSTGAGFNYNAPVFSDRVTRGGPVLRRNAARVIWAYLNTDDRKALRAGVDGHYWWDGRGSRDYSLNPSLTLRPSAAISITGGMRWSRNIDDSQWVANVRNSRKHYVFAHLDQTTVALTTRVNYTITPTLSIQVYAQPFVSAGAYSDFKEMVNGRARRYEDRFAPFSFRGSPDFNFRSFRTTNVLRWEFRPGSSLFLVWQQGREDVLKRGDFQFGRDFGGIFSAPAHNVLLVKFLYWLNM